MNVKIDRLKEFLNNRATTLKNSMIQAESMGEKLNDAGSASNPWTEVLSNGETAEDTLISADVNAKNAFAVSA